MHVRKGEGRRRTADATRASRRRAERRRQEQGGRQRVRQVKQAASARPCGKRDEDHKRMHMPLPLLGS
jgi:hypothetical protein